MKDKTFILVFEVTAPSGDFKMYRKFETQSINQAKDEGFDTANELTTTDAQFELVSIENTKGKSLYHINKPSLK